MPRNSSFSSAIDAWKKDLSDDRVMDDSPSLAHYTKAACGSSREVVAVLSPISHEEVERVVATANAYRVPVYPISRGKQWGMGSRLPVKDGAAIVDLSRMDRIIEVNERFHYAVVEPGVTQKQLIDHINEHGLKLMLNVTGSTSDTSLIGNAMDRGVGYFDSRAHGICNMRVVLGNGETIRTGFGHYENAKTKNLYQHGVGPSLDGLFPQGNFGVVTSACVDLMPSPECHMAAIIKIDDESKLPKLVDALSGLRARGAFTTIAHIGDKERSYMTMAPLLYEQLLMKGAPVGEKTRRQAVEMLERGGFGPWSAAIGILGSPERLKLARKEIRTAIGALAKVRFLTDRLIARAKRLGGALSFVPMVREQLMILKAVEPVYGWTRGDTTDVSIKALYWSSNDFGNLSAGDPDQSDAGVQYCLPIIPACGSDISLVVAETRRVFAKHGFKAAITVNLMDSKSMEGVVSLAFNRRDPEQTKRATECVGEMESRYMEMGYPPYRIGINSMDHVVGDDAFWRTVKELKMALDPNNVIAPGRYNLI